MHLYCKYGIHHLPNHIIFLNHLLHFTKTNVNVHSFNRKLCAKKINRKLKTIYMHLFEDIFRHFPSARLILMFEPESKNFCTFLLLKKLF